MAKSKKKVKLNNILTLLLLITSIAVIGAFGFNIYNIMSTNTGEGETIQQEEVSNEYRNDYYSVGNNPTEINKTYFLELNDALEGKTVTDENGNTYAGDEAIAEAVVKNFIAQYYTWTNKDGNYDIGGMQYIYSPKQSDFESYTLNNFYEDMDLYMSQNDRDSLIQVKDVTINSVTTTESYSVSYTDESGNAVTTTLSCIDVDASWSYEEGTSMNTTDLQKHALFHVVNNNGRWEIGGIE